MATAAKVSAKRASFKFELQTGNLPAVVASTAMTHATKADVSRKAEEGWRLSFVQYKISGKAEKDADFGATFPANFTVEIPSVSYDQVATMANGEKFLNALVADHQDSMISKSANGDSTVDVTNWDALIADYFSTTRGIPLTDIKEWAEETFAAAFVLRMEEMNATAGAEGRAVKTDKQIDLLTRSYVDYIGKICSKSCTLSPDYIKSVRTVLNRLIEVDALEADTFSAEVLRRAENLLRPDAGVIVDSI